MKTFIALLFLAICVASVVAFDAQSFKRQSKIIKEANAAQKTWVARHNQFSGKSTAEIKQMLGLNPEAPKAREAQKTFFAQNKPKYTATSVPTTFDSRTKWPKCIHPIRNQAKCGSCWAFSASEVLSDRFCISSNGTKNEVLSPQDLVSCSSLNMGCNGGNLATTWMYLYFTGIVPDSCLPYVSGDGHVPSCPTNCAAGPHEGKPLSANKYFAKSIYPLWVDLPSKRVADMQKDMLAHGPQQAAFSVYEDFLHYSSGVYVHTTGSLLGGHAIKLVGWGTENGLDYWLVANSWSTTWGEDGYFKIQRGVDMCGIENGAWAGLPKV